MKRPLYYSSAYDRDEDIMRMVKRLQHGGVTHWKVDALAQAVHRATPWAGRPIPWDELSEASRVRGWIAARWTLENT